MKYFLIFLISIITVGKSNNSRLFAHLIRSITLWKNLPSFGSPVHSLGYFAYLGFYV